VGAGCAESFIFGRARVCLFPVRLLIAGVLVPLSSLLSFGNEPRPAAPAAQNASPSQKTKPEMQTPFVASSLGPPAIVIPRLSRPPALVDFLNMKPDGELAQQMTRVSGFVQRDPHDG